MDMEKSLIAERAAEWLEQLEHAGPEERARFVKWLKESPQHGWEILLAKSTDTLLPHLLKDAGIDASDFQRRLTNLQPIDDGLALSMIPPRRKVPSLPAILVRQFRHPRKMAAVIAFIGLVSLTAVAIYAVSERTISTAAGEWRTAQLSDGTVLRAGPRTKAAIHFTDRARVVRLSHGELMLQVAKDRARPFLVETELATARAVGTAFAVRRMERDQVVVTVKEGVVSVNRESPSTAPAGNSSTPEPAVMVNAGEQVQVAPGTLPLRVSQVNLDRELAWTIGKLVFGDGTTIADAVRELNLRNEVQIRLLSPQLAGRPIIGVMDATDPESLAKLIEHIGGVSLIDDGRGSLLLVPHPTTTSADSSEKSEP
jgi:transmembrane sensor